jgi:hypothetical protein
MKRWRAGATALVRGRSAGGTGTRDGSAPCRCAIFAAFEFPTDSPVTCERPAVARTGAERTSGRLEA